MPKYIVNVVIPVECECNDEGEAIDGALDLYRDQKNRWTSNGTSSFNGTEALIGNIECIDSELKLPDGKWIINGVIISYGGHSFDFRNESNRIASVYPNAQNNGQTWGVNCKSISVTHYDAGHCLGFTFGLETALTLAWQHVKGCKNDVDLSEIMNWWNS